MPVSYDFDGRVTIVRMTGLYLTADVRAALIAAFADPRGANAAGLLFDIRGSRSIVQRTADEVRAMAQFIASHGDHFGRRLALLADSGAAFGLMRLGAVAVEQHGIEAAVFRHESDAEEWLGAERPA
jgi:hypothetical protein